MACDIFLIPHNGQFILYDPLRGIISLINSKAAEIVQNRIASGLYKSGLFNFQDKPFQESDMFYNVRNLTFILTTDCSMRCIYCYAEGGKERKVISIDCVDGILRFFERNLDINKDNGVINISFHGGDISTVWELFQESVARIQLIMNGKIKYSVSVGINGILSDRQIAWIISNTDNATVSCDGYAEIHNSLRPLSSGKNSFDLVDNTLRSFDRQNYNYGIRSTITNESVGHMEQIIEFFCSNYSVHRIMVEPVFPMGRGEKISFPQENEFISNFRKADKIAELFGRELVYSGARLNTVTNIFCRALDDSCVITPDGLVSCCYEVLSPGEEFTQKFFYGYYDLIEKKLVLDGKQRKQLFEFVDSAKEKCRECFCKYNCAGDCPVKNAFTAANPGVKVFDRCLVNRELTKDQLLKAMKGTTNSKR